MVGSTFKFRNEIYNMKYKNILYLMTNRSITVLWNFTELLMGRDHLIVVILTILIMDPQIKKLEKK
jgi:hypothetical protein